MGYYTYCRKCHEGMDEPDMQELRQGYMECDHCGEHWDDIDQVDSLFNLIEDLQEQINNLKEEKLC